MLFEENSGNLEDCVGLGSVESGGIDEISDGGRREPEHGRRGVGGGEEPFGRTDGHLIPGPQTDNG